MTKIFIYNGQGISEYSRDDLKTLFESNKIYPSVDVVFSTFTENFDGLNPYIDNVVYVIPGGSAFELDDTLEATQAKFKLQSQIASGCHFLGVCAGAYLATSQFEYCVTNYKKVDAEFIPPTFIIEEDRDKQFGLNLCDEFICRGSFYPSNYYAQPKFENTPLHRKRWHPQVVKLRHDDAQTSQHLFVEGCGLVPANKTNPVFNVRAVYADQANYTFFSKKLNKKFVEENLAAVIARKPNRQKYQSGVLLAGPHIEAVVEDSKMIEICKSQEESELKLSLPNEQAALISSTQSQAKEWVVDELRQFLTYKN